jgi:hypothetical protein
MFDIQKILKRSWHILWNYRLLWVFGFILALAVGGNSLRSNSSYRMNDNQNNPSSNWQNPEWNGLHGDTFAEKWDDALHQMQAGIQKLQADHPVEFRMGISAAITFFIVMLLFGALMAVLRYVAETASIRMVDEYEQSGVKVGFRQAWRYGWSRAAWRLFLVNFIVNLPVLLVFVVLGLAGWWIFSTLMSGVEWAIVNSLIAGIGLSFLLIFATVILMVFLYVLRDIAWRMIVLDGAGVMDALRMAAGLMRRQWKNVGLMWLVMIGLKIAWGIAFIILVFPLLIVSIITALGGALVAVVPSLLTAGVAALLAAPDYWPWIFAAIIGAPFFFVVTFSPILLVNGWSQIYQSSTWTLTYRELKALETVTPAAA